MGKVMDYKEFLELIYERHSGNVKLGLDRILSILAEMVNPQEKLSGFHVGGTNGKGSTCAILEALCQENGITTGLNTSPHLLDYRERIRLNSNDITEQSLLQIYRQWEDVFLRYEASFFEITTSMAFYYFWREKVNASIFEVGLGGRLDGTNPFAAEIAIITSISYDHTKSLGSTLEKIAWEKAGIIKDNQIVVIGDLPSAADRVIAEKVKEKNGKIYRSGSDFRVCNVRLSENGTCFDYQKNDVTFTDLCVNLIGEHQAYNAGLAITAFLLWLDKKGKNCTEYLIRSSLLKVKWQGRMQILQQNPTVIIDGAHNVEGVSILVKNLKAIFKNRKIIFIVAILRDKNLMQMIGEIAEIADYMYITKNKSKRAAEIDEQVAAAEKHSARYETADDVAGAYKLALKSARDEDLIIIAGSLYTISEVLVLKKSEY